MEMVSDEDSLKSLIQHAVLAPSSHNTQPWRFRLSAPSIELYADLERALPVNDPQNRELYISCGCALMNLRVAVANAGWSSRVELLPDVSDRTLLARITIENAPVDVALAKLFDAMLLRRTYRNRFKEEPLEAALQELLRHAAEMEQACLNIIATEDKRDELIKLVREGDSLQWQNETWRRELAQWLHSGRQGDGLKVPGLVAPLVRGVVRHFDMGRSMASQDSFLADESPVLMLLSTEGDAPRAWLQAGQALQRVLLEAQRHGVQASYLNQPIQVAELRPQVQQAFAMDEFPQILLRMGYPDELLPASPRRPVDEVVAE
ncbi:nitroreductase family protein [Marinobacterium maritimum]|uniref:Nitroreductase family protein n=1 Tax=Marinobacterium maritimum TaxID=500162 RepID=A0ABN1I7D4_9GAMM